MQIADNDHCPLIHGSNILEYGAVELLRALSSSHLVYHTHGMNPPSANSKKHHRFPAEIISHGIWLYFRFCLNWRDVEELLFTRRVNTTCEAIRK
jgi:hypothetical protein